MKKSANSKLLSDSQVNENEKLILSLYIKKKAIVEADTLKTLTNSSSRNDVIEKAVDFYFGYITSQISQDYLCGIFGAKMEGLINSLGTRVSRGNFRMAVEMNMLTRLLGTEVSVSKRDYEKIRVNSIQDVKRTNGSINILEAVNDSSEDNLPE